MWSRILTAVLLTATLSVGGASADSQTLTGRFVLDGERPERKRLMTRRNQGILAKSRSALSQPDLVSMTNRDGKPVYDESLQVGQFLGIKNIVVWIRSKDVPKYVRPVAKSAGNVIVRNIPKVEWKDDAFHPRVLTIPANSALALKNSSDRAANFHWMPIRSSPFNVVVPANQKVPTIIFVQQGEIFPARLRNDLAPWSQSWIFPCEHSFVSVTDDEGVFRIDNIPDGKWEFQVWHERCGYIKTGGWSKGRFQLAFQKPATGAIDEPRDLGVVQLGPEVFAENTEPTISEAEFLKLHAELQPNPDEPWRTIPWKISLLDAQRVAAENKKPLFIWAMDGHPLGCT